MSTVFVDFHIVVYPSEGNVDGKHTAHCLNMDVVATGDCAESAVLNLLDTIKATLDASRKHNANPFRDAPKEYWSKLVGGEPLAKCFGK